MFITYTVPFIIMVSSFLMYLFLLNYMFGYSRPSSVGGVTLWRHPDGSMHSKPPKRTIHRYNVEHGGSSLGAWTKYRKKLKYYVFIIFSVIAMVCIMSWLGYYHLFTM